jgi:hypothetical protein
MNAQHNRLDHRLAVLVVLGAVLLSLAAAAPAAEPEASISGRSSGTVACRAARPASIAASAPAPRPSHSAAPSSPASGESHDDVRAQLARQIPLDVLAATCANRRASRGSAAIRAMRRPSSPVGSCAASTGSDQARRGVSPPKAGAPKA